jgi:hypothetical protein
MNFSIVLQSCLERWHRRNNRCGEFTILHSFDPECNVCMEDVHFHNDRVTLHLKASKTDPFREGVDIHLFVASKSISAYGVKYICLKRWQISRSKPKEPFFVMENGKALTRHYFIYSLKRILTSLGYNSDLLWIMDNNIRGLLCPDTNEMHNDNTNTRILLCPKTLC